MFSRSRKKQLLYGFLVAPAFLIIFLGYSAYMGRSKPALIQLFCAEHDCKCADWYRRTIDQYQIENNVWNKGDITSYQQCVFIAEGENKFQAGWVWNWPGFRFNVVAYPNILFGKNPWLPSTSTQLPVRIEHLNCLEAKFDVVQTGAGKQNLAFDLWITNDQSSNPTNITHEIMIWLSSTGVWPAGSKVATLEIEGKKIDLWMKVKHQPLEAEAWTFLAFVYQADHTTGTIRIHHLLDYLVEQGYIDAQAYLSGIQFGNEIVSGYGKTNINNFEVNFCKE